MIKVVIKENNQQIVFVNVTGHANSDEYGNDLVCAGVSAICVGIANQLVNIGFMNDLGTVHINEGNFKVQVNQTNHDVQLVLETFETMMKTIQESYDKYIEIMKMEV